MSSLYQIVRNVERAAEEISKADALIIGAGAGMGVDSGLPDFRGDQGFWKAYPAYGKLGLSFSDLANPGWFQRDPNLAWGFYGHRFNLYRETSPHDGFHVLRRWSDKMKHGSFVFTSNVDGQFQKAGFSPQRVVECHGSISNFQCTTDCGAGVFSNHQPINVDPATFRAFGKLPSCTKCGALARPNILMFGDYGWDEGPSKAQRTMLLSWLNSVRDKKIVIVECGAGTAIPSVRMFCENLAGGMDATLIRLNIREHEVPEGGLGIPLGALKALNMIDSLLHP